MNTATRSRLCDVAIAITSVALILALVGGLIDRRSTGVLPSASPSVLIDPGHGGADGGASGADGTLEKTINLAVSLPLADMLRVMGYTVNMTRDADTMVDATGETMRERKVSDIHNRLAQSRQSDFTVSIHQNKFPQTQYFGTQVFYSVNDSDSKVLAESVRESVVSLLQPDNTRPLKPGSSEVYLLHHAERPMILVECGFLSNEVEREKLKKEEYQRQMAFAVTAGILNNA